VWHRELLGVLGNSEVANPFTHQSFATLISTTKQAQIVTEGLTDK
jgi:hypothetical protein